MQRVRRLLTTTRYQQLAEVLGDLLMQRYECRIGIRSPSRVASLVRVGSLICCVHRVMIPSVVAGSACSYRSDASMESVARGYAG